MMTRPSPRGSGAVIDVDVAVVGAGPCGLACAYELKRLGLESWLVLEAADRVGGLAASVRDSAGFTWDLGGHVVFSHYDEFDGLMRRVMPEEELLRHDRSSFIRFGDSWVPYPFQQHLRHLPAEVAIECLVGLIEAQTTFRSDRACSFLDWLIRTFGEALTRHFFVPYNTKVWTTPLVEMSAEWVAERVAGLDWKAAIRNALTACDPPAWGPNSTFLFPRSGGTGAIWSRLAATLDDRVWLNARVTKVDCGSRLLFLSDGTAVRYAQVVSTMPLDQLIATITVAPPDCLDAVSDLRYNSVYMVGLGYASPVSDTVSWRYFPEASVPFYRATNFGKYAAANLPGADASRFSSWMTEIAVPAGTQRHADRLISDTDAALRRSGLVPGGARRVSAHVEFVERAYPVPTLRRDAALTVLQGWLGDHGIRSRGRFGTWRYEVGNMDHAVKMGIDAARSIMCDADEELCPDLTNAVAGGR